MPHTPVPRAAGSLPFSPASLVTIRMQDIYRSWSDNYIRLLGEIVFPLGTRLEDDRK
jgi:hypothetical protein